jgi:DNA-binding NarL/FixJ family response regulator
MRGAHFDGGGTRHVLVGDDHAPTLAAISTLLDFEQPDIEVVGMARNAAGALRLARDVAPDVVVLDLDLDGENGLELIPTLTLNCGAAVIILTSSNDPQKRRQGFAAGARAFVSKYAPSGELVAAILAVQPKAAE